MGNMTRTARVRFDGDVRGLSAAARKAEKDLDRLQSKAKSFATGFAAVGAASALGGAAIGAALPVLGSLALQFGVVKLAMSSGNKEAKRFQKQLDTFNKPIKKLRDTAAKGLFPGVIEGLKGAIGLFPILTDAVSRTANIMGDTAVRLGALFKTDSFKKDLTGFLRATEPVTKGIGDLFVTVTGALIKFGAAMRPAAEGFANFLRSVGTGLSGLFDGLAPHADSFKRIFTSLGTIIGDILPLVGQFAGAVADRLAPILEKVAGFIDRNKDAISRWIPTLAQAAVVLGGLRIAAAVAGSVASLTSGIGALITKLGGLKVVAGGIALAALAIEMDKVNAASEQGNLSGWNGELHDIVRILTGDWGNPIEDINRQLGEVNAKWSAGQAPVQQWALSVGKAAATAGLAVQNFFRGLVGLPPLPPINLDVDPSTGQAKVKEFVGGISRTRGTLTIDGNPDPATGKVKQTVTLANGSKGVITVDGNPIPANGKVTGAIRFANGSKGTVTIDGNQTPANGKINATVTYANGRRGTIQVDANTAAANSRIAGLVSNWNGRHINLIVTSTGSGGIASAARLATGGPINGPGTGTSDTAGLFALSRGEHVFTAREVQAMGGQASVLAFRRGLVGGTPRRFASTSGAATGGSVASSGPGAPLVQVFIDGQEMRGMVRTEISESNRQARRLVGAGTYRGV